MADADLDTQVMDYNDFTVFVHTTAAAENEWTTQEKYTIFHRLERDGTVFTKPDALNPMYGFSTTALPLQNPELLNWLSSSSITL